MLGKPRSSIESNEKPYEQHLNRFILPFLCLSLSRDISSDKLFQEIEKNSDQS